MNAIPRFSEAIISQTLTQGQAKLVLTALVALERLAGNPDLAAEFHTSIDHAQTTFGFSFTEPQQQDPQLIQDMTCQLIDMIFDAYHQERWKHIDTAEAHLNDLAGEHVDHDVFNLVAGGSVRLELS